MDSSENQTICYRSQRNEGRKRDQRQRRDVVGRYVMKSLIGVKLFLGKVVNYDRGFYRVDYGDGKYEDLNYSEVCEFLIDKTEESSLGDRKRKLDRMMSRGYSDTPRKCSRRRSITTKNKPDGVIEASPSSGKMVSDIASSSGKCPQCDASQKPLKHSCGDSSVSIQILSPCSQAKLPLLDPFPLPPSSNNIDIPDESVPFLFSVYSFLRSFSHRLFLSPFSLDDFVGSLKCNIANSLLDCIHVSLMRALRRHLQAAASDSNELASKCLRYLDWNLLDTLTWPIYLLEYLLVTGYSISLVLGESQVSILYEEYYILPSPTKLRILQILCDSVLESEELRAELDMREDLEMDMDINKYHNPLEHGPKKVHPRYSKIVACKDQRIAQDTPFSFESEDAIPNAEFDGNSDECCLCGMDGMLVCCDGCPLAYHSRCVGLNKGFLPEGLWFCPECTVNRIDPRLSKIGTGLKGADIFGVDQYGRVYLGTYNFLLLIASSENGKSFSRYYNQNDVLQILHLLSSMEQHSILHSHICKEIVRFWSLPEDSCFSQHVGSECVTHSVERKEEDRTQLGPSQDIQSICTIPKKDSMDQVRTVPDAFNVIDSLSPMKNKMKISEDSDIGIHQDEDALEFDTLTKSKICEQYALDAAVSTECASVSSVPFDCNNKMETFKISAPYYGGTFFKPHAYLNLYIQGDIAASAAANLAVALGSHDGNGFPGIGTSSKNTTRNVSSNTALQLKAFTGAVMHFFWPTSDKKLMDVPRERCGWCMSCKAPPTTKKGCLLNFAASNSLKFPTKASLNGIQRMKNCIGHLSEIATYILLMEENLRGLLLGVFLSPKHRTQWRKLVEQAPSCRVLKFLLLELEENIRSIVMSEGWFSLLDDWPNRCFITRSSISSTSPDEKYGSVGRRKKQREASKTIHHFNSVSSSNFFWWRGGLVSQMIFKKGALPCTVVRKASRQGGCGKISGLFYNKNLDALPQKNQQLGWRAAVEMSRNTSSLALQVRYLSAHIRWSELKHPECLPQDARTSENDAACFRNAIICGKKDIENKITYALTFQNWNHLPSRIMKNLIEVEENQNEQQKLWFWEKHLPLYLIKEYEEKEDKITSSTSWKDFHRLSKLWSSKLREFRGNIFSYLMHREDKLGKCTWTLCQCDVQLRNSVQCCSCLGYCHKDCSVPKIVDLNDKLHFDFTCKNCHHHDESCQVDEKKELKNQLEANNTFALSSTHILKKNGHQTPLSSIGIDDGAMKQTISKKVSEWPTVHGLIWRKKNGLESGTDFRLKHILLPSTGIVDDLTGPTCRLCDEPYNSNLTYIRCPHCSSWYHGDAVLFSETQLSNLEGFKCCKCRRKALPICPYMKSDRRKKRLRTPKSGIIDQKRAPKITVQQPMAVDIIEQQNVCNKRIHSFSVSGINGENGVMTESDSLLGHDQEPIINNLSEVDERWKEITSPDLQNLDNCHTKAPDEEGAFTSCVANSLCSQIEIGSTDSFPVEVSPVKELSEVGVHCNNISLASDQPNNLFRSQKDLCTSSDTDITAIAKASLSHGSSQQEDIYSLQKDMNVAKETPSNVASCLMCNGTQPSPDLCCEVCSLLIHNHCSPWDEIFVSNSKWRCGRCMKHWR